MHKTMDWILLKDEKPRNFQTVIVTNKYGDIYIASYYSMRRGFSEKSCPEDNEIDRNVVGWIPLPDPLED